MIEKRLRISVSTFKYHTIDSNTRSNTLSSHWKRQRMCKDCSRRKRQARRSPSPWLRVAASRADPTQSATRGRCSRGHHLHPKTHPHKHYRRYMWHASQADSIGFVFERERQLHEMDAMQWSRSIVVFGALKFCLILAPPKILTLYF